MLERILVRWMMNRLSYVTAHAAELVEPAVGVLVNGGLDGDQVAAAPNGGERSAVNGDIPGATAFAPGQPQAKTK